MASRRWSAQAAPGVPVDGAGGLSGGRLGTNGLEVADALRRVAAPRPATKASLVLLDLGSASHGRWTSPSTSSIPRIGRRSGVTEAPLRRRCGPGGRGLGGRRQLIAVAAAAERGSSMPKLPREPDPCPARTSPGAPSVTVMTVTDAWLRCTAREVHERRLWLTELDAAIGDGDHGINLDRGFAARRSRTWSAARSRPTMPARCSTSAGRRLLGLVGGASGALYGRALMTAGTRLTERASDLGIDQRRLVEVALAGAVDGDHRARPRRPRATRPCWMPWVRPWTRCGPPRRTRPLEDVMLAMAEAAESGRGGHDPARRPQGSGELSRRAVHRPSRPRRRVERHPRPLPRERRDRDRQAADAAR